MGDTATNQDQVAYDAAYEAEMKRLEDEASAANKSANTEATKADTTAEPTETTQKNAENSPEEDRYKQLESRLQSTEKALNDTKKWAQQSRQEVKRLQQEREAEQRAANKPAVLVDNPGLEEAIQHVAGIPSGQGKTQQQKVDDWAAAVGKALPDLDELLDKNPELRAKAAALSQDLGDEWMDPLVAIRELGKLQVEHVRAGVSAAAAAQAKQDFERKQQKHTAMSVPGNGGTARPAANAADDPDRWARMSSADFAKERAKVLGY